MNNCNTDRCRACELDWLNLQEFKDRYNNNNNNNNNNTKTKLTQSYGSGSVKEIEIKEEEKETEKEKEKVISTHKSPHSHPHPKFDIILALECVYREDLYQPLIDSILQSSVPSTLIFLGLTRLFAQVRDDKCRDMKI